jgi:hypothetical protein
MNTRGMAAIIKLINLQQTRQLLHQHLAFHVSAHGAVQRSLNGPDT